MSDVRLRDDQWCVIKPRLPPPAGGDPVRPARRLPLGRPAGRVRRAGHGLAAAADLGGAGRVGGDPAGGAGRLRRRAAAGLGDGLPGRLVRAGQEGGAAVGLTRTGEGTKWMLVVGGRGTPVGVRPAGASEAGAHPAEPTLDGIRVARRRGIEARIPPKRRPTAYQGFFTPALMLIAIDRLLKKILTLTGPKYSGNPSLDAAREACRHDSRASLAQFGRVGLMGRRRRQPSAGASADGGAAESPPGPRASTRPRPPRHRSAAALARASVA
jgi:hypothetical protein